MMLPMFGTSASLKTTGRALGLSLAAFAAMIGIAQAQTFSVGANFTTINRNQTGIVSGFIIEPPDTMGAAGPNHFVAFNNGSFSIFSKTGALVSQTSDATFWANALGGDPGGLSDPRILYDPASQRWFATMITTDQTTNNKILFARSNTSDPTQGFKAVSFTTTNNRFADFPTLGLDANGIYVGTNNFNSSGTTLRSLGLYSVPKADLLASTPSLARLTTTHNALSTNTYGFTFQAAVNYGPKSASDPEPILSTPNSTSFSQYKFESLSGTTGAGATLSSVTNKTVQSVSEPTNSSQAETSATLDNGDNRFSANVVQVGNFLYAVESTPVSGRTAVRWTIANATTFAVVQQGTISDSSLTYFYPAIAVNPTGDVVVGFSGSNSSTFASTYAVAGSSAGGVPGGSLTFGTPVQTKTGTDFYPIDPGSTSTRWGDYSAVTPDPADPGVFWAHQEYATNKFTNGGSTLGNWATQASEIIPVKSGERRWSNIAGGSFTVGGNYFTGAAPVASDQVIFSRPSATYTVAFSGNSASDRASVRQGTVTWDLGGNSYTLSNVNTATPSLVVGEFQGTASLTVANGALNSVNANVGGAAVGSGAVTVNSGTTWTNSSALSVGASGLGTLTTQSLGTTYVGTNLSIGASGTVNLNGGTIRFDGYTRAVGGAISFPSGTVQLAGNRTIDTDPAVKDWFGAAPSIGVGKKLVVEGNATVSGATTIMLAGGILEAHSLLMSSGSQLATTQSSQVVGPVAAMSGSTIDASGGDLTIGDPARADGFYSNGALSVGSSTITVVDSDGGDFGVAANVTLGAGGNPGTLAAATGLTLSPGGNIAGYGAINSPNNAATPVVINGSLSGNAWAALLTLPGYVKGTGTLDNVAFNGTFSPGLSPASVSLGSVKYIGTLEMEIGGRTAGSDYDQLNHTLGSGFAELGGMLDVTLLNNFSPQAGDLFDIITAAGGISGTFASMTLPTLSGDLFWTINYGANSVELTVSEPTPVLQGDFNDDGSVDAADYVTWRKNDGPDSDYDTWRSNFGQTAGSGSGAGVNAAIPEPATLMLLVFAAAGWCLYQSRTT